MNRLVQLTALAAIVLSLNSCGLPAALGRTAGNVVNGVGDMANQVMTTGF
ncbi:MAG: hypothetical protein V4819_13700 [Verrucomicrobiota bacterium]